MITTGFESVDDFIDEDCMSGSIFSFNSKNNDNIINILIDKNLLLNKKILYISNKEIEPNNKFISINMNKFWPLYLEDLLEHLNKKNHTPDLLIFNLESSNDIVYFLRNIAVCKNISVFFVNCKFLYHVDVYYDIMEHEDHFIIDVIKNRYGYCIANHKVKKIRQENDE